MENKGFGLLSVEGNQTMYIGSTVRNGVEFNIIGLSTINGIVMQVSYGNLYTSQQELARALLICGPKIEEAYKQYEVPTYSQRDMRFEDGKYYVSINTSYQNGYHYLVVSYGKN